MSWQVRYHDQNYPNPGKAQNLQCHDFGPACYAIAHPSLLGWSWNWNWRNHFLLVLVLPSRAGRQEKVAKCSAVINIPTITTFTVAITIIQHFLLAPAGVSRWKDAMRLISCELQFVPDIILLIPHTLCSTELLKAEFGRLKRMHCIIKCTLCSWEWKERHTLAKCKELKRDKSGWMEGEVKLMPDATRTNLTSSELQKRMRL